MVEPLDVVPVGERALLAYETAEAFLGHDARDQYPTSTYVAARRRFGEDALRELWRAFDGMSRRLADTLDARDVAYEVLELTAGNHLTMAERDWAVRHLRDTLAVAGDLIEARRAISTILTTVGDALAAQPVVPGGEEAAAVAELHGRLTAAAEFVADREGETLDEGQLRLVADAVAGYSGELSDPMARAAVADSDVRVGGLRPLLEAWSELDGQPAQLARVILTVLAIGRQRRDLRLLHGELSVMNRPPAGPFVCVIAEPASVDALWRLGGGGPVSRRRIVESSPTSVDIVMRDVIVAVLRDGDVAAGEARLSGYLDELEQAIENHRSLAPAARPQAHQLVRALRDQLSGAS